MEYLFIIGLLLVIGFTSSNGFLRLVGQSLGLSAAAAFVTLVAVGIGCSGLKLLPYRYCGELSGLFNMAATAILVGILVFIVILIINLKKYKFEAVKRDK